METGNNVWKQCALPVITTMALWQRMCPSA